MNKFSYSIKDHVLSAYYIFIIIYNVDLHLDYLLQKLLRYNDDKENFHLNLKSLNILAGGRKREKPEIVPVPISLE